MAASEALAGLLVDATADLAPLPSVFDTPPTSVNPPALIVQFPTTITKHVPTFAIDQVDWTVSAVAGLGDPETLDELLAVATAAVEADPSLGQVVQICKPVEHRNWRLLTVAGADFLAADLILETRM